MGLAVEQECPQCGAPIALEETDHLMRCPYCNVINFIHTPDYFRFLLPYNTPSEEIFFAPYLRFKGNVYFCTDEKVGHRVVDITRLGIAFDGLPVSLGFRPQAMKMRFATPDMPGSFLKFSLKAGDILASAGNLSSGPRSDRILHRAYIGETLSIIYLPLFENSSALFDAILDRPIVRLSNGSETLEPLINRNPRWRLTFLATLCPDCGWNLTGERDSVVLTCSNCDTAWEAVEGEFTKVKFFEVPGGNKESSYLPFWKISARARGVEINSFADFVRLTNQPRVLGKDWENREMSFWSPAFKIPPKVFMNLSRQFTIAQRFFEIGNKIPKENLYPVTLPRSEAAQAMKITLAVSTLSKNNVFPYLPQISFEILDSVLVYLPFKDTGHEMIQEHMQISINKNTLEFGRRL